MKNKYVYGFIIFIIGLICGLLISQKLIKKNVIPSQPAVNNEKNIESNNQPYPWLNLPMEYFSEEDIRTGYSKQDNSKEYTSAAFGGESAYRSYPSTNVKQIAYDTKPYVYERRKYNDGVSVRPVEVEGDKYWERLMKESRTKFGDIVTTYWPDYLVGSIDEFDVDNDSSKEKIAYLSTPGVNSLGGRVDIIKNGKIIFSSGEYYSTIEPSKTKNGFYLLWTSADQFDQRLGEMRTRFVFKDNKFIPVYEQEVKYLKIGKK